MVEGLVVTAVCQIPLAYRRPGGKSLQRLVTESGYFENRDELSVNAVRKFLRENPELVDQWLYFSEDKRTSTGWYVIAEKDRFVVGQIDGLRFEFPDPTLACAEFIVREIGEVTPPE